MSAYLRGDIASLENQIAESNHAPVTSFAVSLVVTPAGTADFALANKTPPQIIPPGTAASFTIAVISVNATFTNAVTLTASGLPPGASYTFTPRAMVAPHIVVVWRRSELLRRRVFQPSLSGPTSSL